VAHFETQAIYAKLEHDEVGTLHLLRESKGQRERTMEQGDYVKVTGIDGFYVFLKEVQGMATLRVCSMHDPDKPTIAIAIDRVVSLKTTN
jgi:hypothetical protein